MPSPRKARSSLGLIWLDYLRQREKRAFMSKALRFSFPREPKITTCYHDAAPHLGRRALSGICAPWRPRRSWSIRVITRTSRRDLRHDSRDSRGAIRGSPAGSTGLRGSRGVERRDHVNGSVGLLVRGLEFARAAGDELRFGLDHKHAASTEAHIEEIERLASGLARMHSPTPRTG